jgi:cell division protein FtsL
MTNKKVSSKEREQSGKSILSIGLIVLILVAVGLSLVYVRIKVEELSLGYEISRNKKKTQDLLKENRTLQSDFMKLKSPQKLEQMAVELGFKFPTQQDIIYIEKNKVVGNK